MADAGQLAVMPVCVFGYIPQWLTILRNRSSADISLWAQLLWLLGSTLAFFYAAVHSMVSIGALPLLLSSFSNLACVVVTTMLVLGFRRGAKSQLNESEREKR